MMDRTHTNHHITSFLRWQLHYMRQHPKDNHSREATAMYPSALRTQHMHMYIHSKGNRFDEAIVTHLDVLPELPHYIQMHLKIACSHGAITIY
jgi:hypothetical protein